MPARKYTLEQLPKDRPMPLIERRRIVGEKMMISEVFLTRGFELASHQHDNEQIVVVLSGKCRFGIGKSGTSEYQELEVIGGDVLHLPGNCPHSCRALEDTRILDLFSPVSEKTGVDRA